MGGTTRVPDKDQDFDTYINAATDHLLAGTTPLNWERLLLLTGEMDEWSDYRDNWNILYGKWGNPATRTKVITKSKNDLKKNFRNFSELLLQRMGSSPDITTEDRAILHIPIPDRIHSDRTKIDVSPVVAVISKTGGRIEVRCRMSEDATRASMHPDADAIEVKIKIGTPAPTTAADCPIKETFTTAIFDYEAGAENDGKRIWVFARYVNLSDPSKSGDFGTAAYTTIQG